MIDYAEGYTELKRLVDDVWKAMVDQRFSDARALCDQIVVEARITKAQIGAQTREQNEH